VVIVLGHRGLFRWAQGQEASEHVWHTIVLQNPKSISNSTT
jgi:hypothetical protein